MRRGELHVHFLEAGADQRRVDVREVRVNGVWTARATLIEWTVGSWGRGQLVVDVSRLRDIARRYRSNESAFLAEMGATSPWPGLMKATSFALDVGPPRPEVQDVAAARSLERSGDDVVRQELAVRSAPAVAARLYGNALRSSAASSRLRIKYALALQRAGDHWPAARALSSMTKEGANNLHFLAAASFLAVGDVARAGSELGHVSAVTPALLAQRARVHFRLGRPVDACLLDARQAVREQPSVDSLLMLAMLERRASHVNRSLVAIRTAMERGPNDERCWRAAELLARQRGLLRAAEAYRARWEKERESPDAPARRWLRHVLRWREWQRPVLETIEDDAK